MKLMMCIFFCLSAFANPVTFEDLKQKILVQYNCNSCHATASGWNIPRPFTRENIHEGRYINHDKPEFGGIYHSIESGRMPRKKELTEEQKQEIFDLLTGFSKSQREWALIGEHDLAVDFGNFQTTDKLRFKFVDGELTGSLTAYPAGWTSDLEDIVLTPQKLTFNLWAKEHGGFRVNYDFDLTKGSNGQIELMKGLMTIENRPMQADLSWISKKQLLRNSLVGAYKLKLENNTTSNEFLINLNEFEFLLERNILLRVKALNEKRMTTVEIENDLSLVFSFVTDYHTWSTLRFEGQKVGDEVHGEVFFYKRRKREAKKVSDFKLK